MKAITTKNGYTLTIEQDQDITDSPRDWDNLGKMVCFHRRYNLGDKHDFKTPEDAKDFLRGGELGSEVAVSLPLFLLDHSGLSMSTGDFGDPWDSGQVGFIYATWDDVKKEYGDTSPESLQRAKEVLQGEVETYDQYLRGDVYYYKIEDEDGEIVESCGGYYGEEYAKNDGIRSLNALAKKKVKK